MIRLLATCVVFCLTAYPALAASPKVNSAVKVFKAVGADAGKLKTFCTMTKAMDAAGDAPSAAAEAQITTYMKQIGPDFETAWNASEGLDENSADGKAFDAALDELSGKCPN